MCLVCQSFSGAAFFKELMHLSARQRNENTREICLWASWLQLPEQSNISPSEKQQRKQQKSLAMLLAFPSALHIWLSSLPPILHSLSFSKYLRSTSCYVKGISTAWGQHEIKSTQPLPISRLPCSYVPQNEPLGTDMLLRCFLLKHKGDYSRVAQLEKEDCANAAPLHPSMKRTPKYTEAGRRQAGVDRKHANISNFSFLIFCCEQGREQRLLPNWKSLS